MFHILDHDDVVYSGDLSHSTQYVSEHYGMNLDDAIYAGVRLVYTDMQHSMNQAKEMVLGRKCLDEWDSISHWKDD